MEKARFLQGSILLIFSFHNREKSIAFVISTCALLCRSPLRRMTKNLRALIALAKTFHNGRWRWIWKPKECGMKKTSSKLIPAILVLIFCSSLFVSAGNAEEETRRIRTEPGYHKFILTKGKSVEVCEAFCRGSIKHGLTKYLPVIDRKILMYLVLKSLTVLRLHLKSFI